MWSELLSEIGPSGVRLVLSDDPARVLGDIEGDAFDDVGGDHASPQFVGCVWESLPSLAELIPDAVDALAQTALACWPNWYAETPQRRFDLRAARSREPAELLDMQSLRQARVPVLEPWLREAVDCCIAGQLPRSVGFADAVQAAQLALAIDPSRLVLLLAVTQAEQLPERLDGLARAAEWFARTTGAPVAVVVPDELAANTALDSVSFNPLRLDDRCSVPLVQADAGADFDAPERQDTPTISDGSRVAGTQTAAATEPRPAVPQSERSELFVWPLHGVPHPRSEGEQRLAERLRRDDELAAMFEFNQPVTTTRDTLHNVDLLWRSGRVVVEVDGYRWHSSREMFARDRQRDYELMISGFLVLRMTHAEILRDVELAVEKIRDVVRVRRGDTGRQHAGDDRDSF